MYKTKKPAHHPARYRSFADVLLEKLHVLFCYGVFYLREFLFSAAGPAREVVKRGERPPTANLSVLPRGVVFGRRSGLYVVKKEAEDGHVAMMGGTGDGKSSCGGITTGISWRSGIWALDPKGELAKRCLFRRNKAFAKVFDPLDDAAYGYDPYYQLSASADKQGCALEIAMAVVPEIKNAKDPFWVEEAQGLLTGAILHYQDLGYSFLETMVAVNESDAQELVDTLLESRVYEARLYGKQCAKIESKLLRSIYKQLTNKTMIYAANPTIRRCLSKEKNITPRDVEMGYDVFIVFPEEMIRKIRGLLVLMVVQQLNELERRPDREGTPLLVLIEEFARIGKIEIIAEALATLRSKNVTLCLIFQSLAQVDMLYGREMRRVIMDNCKYKLIFGAGDAETQQYLSNIIGTNELERRSESQSFSQGSEEPYSTGETRSVEEKRIYRPEEFSSLDEVILVAKFGFSSLKKTPYYRSRYFLPPSQGWAGQQKNEG